MEQKQAAVTNDAAVKSASVAREPSPQQSFFHDAPFYFLQRLHGGIGNRATGRWLQTKLRVGAINDLYEQEADRVADLVTRTPSPTLGRTRNSIGDVGVQRKCAACEDEENLQRKCEQCEHEEEIQRKCSECGEVEPVLQRRETNPGGAAPSMVENILSSDGQPLDTAARAFMEPRFGQDFSQVRIHTDEAAARSARAVNALAYTVGSDVVFDSNRYAPTTVEGQRLLAHELTHVVQQSQGAATSAFPIVQRQTPSTDPTLTVSGDAQRTSPPGGVALGGGVLTWNERFRGVSFSSTMGPNNTIQITPPIDVQMDVTFTPDAATAAQCPTITFLQTVIPTIGGIPDAPHLLFTRDATSGASADVRAGETEPLYGLGRSSTGPGLQPDMSNTVAGSAPGRSAIASFGDGPFLRWDLIPPGQVAVRSFEVAPICVETARTFGSIRWGFTKTRAGVITLTGGQVSDVQTGSATPQLESVRQAFYAGFFQFSVSNFVRGSAHLNSGQQPTLQQVLASIGGARQIVLVGANDFSGGPENNAALSLQRAEAVKGFLVSNGVPAANIQTQGHGVEARVPNTPGHQEPANRRVDVHIERGTSPLGEGATSPNPVGSAREALRFRRQDPHGTFRELGDLLFQLQGMTGRIPLPLCNQLTHMADGLRRWRGLDRSVPDVDSIYGPTIRSLLSRCVSLMPRAPFEYQLPPLQPPSFLPRIEESVQGPPFVQRKCDNCDEQQDARSTADGESRPLAAVSLRSPLLIARQEGGQADVPPGSPLAQVIAALNRPDEVAGVGDYREAFQVLNGLNMFDMLRTLEGLARRQMIDLLAEHIESAIGVNRPRIEAAIATIRLRPPDSPMVSPTRVAALGNSYNDLPPEQRADIREYLSGSRAEPAPPGPPPNLSTVGADAFEPGMANVAWAQAATDPLWIENDIASTELSQRAPWTYTLTYSDRSRLTIPLTQFADHPLATPVTLLRRHHATQRLVPFVANALDPAFRSGSAGSNWQEQAASGAQPRFDPSTAPRLVALLNQDQIVFMAIGVLHVLELQLANPVVAGGMRPSGGAGSLGRAGAGIGGRALAGGGGRAAFTFVEIGAGDLQAAIRLARQGGVRVIAVDTAEAPAAAVRELESLGGTFVRGQAADVGAGVADHVFQYFPWRISGTGRSLGGGTWRLVQDTLQLLRSNGAAHFVTEDLETAKFLAEEASKRGLRTVLTETTAGAAAPGASGAGVPGFSASTPVWQVNIYP